MNIDDLVLVSVDDHVIEPAHMFEGRVAKKYQDKAPRFVRRDDGTMAWVYEGKEILNPALNAVAGRPPSEFGMEPTSIEEIRLGCYDIDARVKDMSANGVLGSMCFPSFPRFCGQLFMETADKEQAAEMVRAYNDWHIEDWAGTHPGRIIPLGLPMMWDPVGTAAEVRRLAAKGCHAVTFSSSPYDLGLPSIYDEHWDPFWEACADEGTVVCIHLG
ncbi:MAG TPA: amidohydrolase family protein, partial [Mycobacterium sp.]